MVRSFSTFAGWVEYSPNSIFASWTRYYAVLEGPLLVLYTKEAEHEDLTDADKFMEIPLEEEGVRVEMESAGGKVIVIRRSAGNVKLRTETAAAWLRWLTDIRT